MALLTLPPAIRPRLAWLVLLLGAACSASILSGAAFLTVRMGPLPLGNLVAWGMIAAPPCALLLFPGGDGPGRRWALGTAVGAGLWLPVAALLAGNVALVFPGGPRFLAWIVYTGLVLLVGYILLSVRSVQWLKARLAQR